MKNIIHKMKVLKNNIFKGYANVHYSSQGEDIILQNIFIGKKNGFYVDIGAYHPFEYSNTYLLYKRGWHGINIDANYEAIEKIRKKRKRDISIHAVVSDKIQDVKYYLYKTPAYNTICENIVIKLEKMHSKKPIAITNIKTKKLVDILDTYLAPGISIDYMNIDVEGNDMNVLQSNDWLRFNPEVISVEIQKYSIQECINSELNHYLEEKNYVFFAKTFNTLFYMHKKYFEKRIDKVD